jgi:hypothetical protein
MYGRNQSSGYREGITCMEMAWQKRGKSRAAVDFLWILPLAGDSADT